MLIRLRESYVVGAGPVVLDVVSGEGQKSLIRVRLGGVVLKEAKTIEKLNLGSGPDLEGKTLRVVATVTDTNQATNHTSVTYTFTNDGEKKEFTSDHTVDSEGETVDYDAKFLLI